MNYLEYIKSIPKYQTGGYFLPTPDVSTNPDAPFVGIEQYLRNKLTENPERFRTMSNNAQYEATNVQIQDQLNMSEQFRDEFNQLGIPFNPVDNMRSQMPLINLAYDVRHAREPFARAARRGEISEADAQKLNALDDLSKRIWAAYDTKSPEVDSLYNKSREYWNKYRSLVNANK